MKNKPTPQDTFDALSCELTENEIIEMLVKKAIGYLEYDDAYPDVGMGMFYEEAIDLAVDDLYEEARGWRRKIYISDSTKKKAREIVIKKRSR